MLIAEHLALIALNPGVGLARKGLEWAHDQYFLSGCLLMELAVQTRLGARGDVVVVLDAMPSRHPLLTQALKIVREFSGRLEPDEAINQVATRIRSLRDELLEALVRRDLLHPPKRRYFNLFGQKLFPVRSMQAQSEALDRLHRAAVGAQNDLHGLAVLYLCHVSGLNHRLLTREEDEEAKSRIELLRAEIDLELKHNAELLDEQYSIQLMARLAESLERRLRPKL
jgi:hypothetical protein